MCFPYLNQFTGGNNRRRRPHSAQRGTSPRSVSNHVRRVSPDSVRPAVSSIKPAAATRGNVNVGNPPVPRDVNSTESGLRQSAATIHIGGDPTDSANPAAVVSNAGPASGSEAGGNERSGKRSTWWGFFGMGKK